MKKTLDKSKLVKEMARERVGQVPTTKVVPNKKRCNPKHPKRDLALETE